MYKIKLTGRSSDVKCKHLKFISNVLSSKNSHIRDKNVIFYEDGHKYYIKGVESRISCTSLTGKYFAPFDSIAISEKCAGKGKYKDMTPENIRDKWNMTGVLGTEMHANIEFLLNLMECDRYKEKDFIIEDSNVEENVKSWKERFNSILSAKDEYRMLRPYRTEWVIYDEKLMVAGSVDMVFTTMGGLPKGLFENIPDWVLNSQPKIKFKKEKKYHWIFDWKRTEDIPSTSFNKSKVLMKGSNLHDCKFIKYSFQLNWYRYMLENSYDLPIAGMVLVAVHPTTNKVKFHLVPFLDKEVGIILEEFKENI